jgi:hypothetical protein
MPMKMRDARALRRRLAELDQKLTEEDLADRALVHALAQKGFYENRMRRNRIRYGLTESGALLLAGAATVLAALSAPAWLTAVVAALVTFLAGIRRIFNWHADWLAHAEAWSRASALVSQYRLLRRDERSADKQRELVAAIDDLVVEETHSWGRRRRDLLRHESSSAAA